MAREAAALYLNESIKPHVKTIEAAKLREMLGNANDVAIAAQARANTRLFESIEKGKTQQVDEVKVMVSSRFHSPESNDFISVRLSS